MRFALEPEQAQERQPRDLRGSRIIARPGRLVDQPPGRPACLTPPARIGIGQVRRQQRPRTSRRGVIGGGFDRGHRGSAAWQGRSVTPGTAPYPAGRLAGMNVELRLNGERQVVPARGQFALKPVSG